MKTETTNKISHALRDSGLDVEYRFNDVNPAGIERRYFGANVRVTGWKIGANAYFGKTRIGEKSAYGFVIPHGNSVVDITHRGIRYTRFF